MKVLTFLDSYHYYGLWDNSMRIVSNGKYIPLQNICKNTELYSCFGTKDTLAIYTVNAENIEIEDIFYLDNETNYKNGKIISEINKITYFSKDFEKHIPEIMQNYRNKEHNTKITFIYKPVNEKEFFSIEENLISCVKDKLIREKDIETILKEIA